jgi:hypothetical protein
VSVDPLSSSLSGEPIPISIQESNRVQKKSRRMKQSLGGMSPASGHHVGVKPLAFVDHAGGKVPTYGHHVGKKTHNGYHPSIVHFWFQAHLKMKPTPSKFHFVSSSCKNETNPEHSFIFCFKLM